jgi:hypothetical protein
MIKNLWKSIDGNKTLICAIVFGFVTKFGVEIGIPPNIVAMVQWISGMLGIPSIIHHVMKGNFGTNKN